MADEIIGKKQSLENYFKDIGEVELLTPNEEIDLARRIQRNDHDALKKLVNANLRFVVSVAKSTKHVGLNLFHTLFGGLSSRFYKLLQKKLD